MTKTTTLTPGLSVIDHPDNVLGHYNVLWQGKVIGQVLLNGRNRWGATTARFIQYCSHFRSMEGAANWVGLMMEVPA